jgi:hypothetical protein
MEWKGESDGLSSHRQDIDEDEKSSQRAHKQEINELWGSKSRRRLLAVRLLCLLLRVIAMRCARY